MKKIFFAITMTIFACILASCSCGSTQNTKRIINASEVYSDEDINAAMDAVGKSFREFNGCDLLEIRYDDSYLEREKSYVEEAKEKNKQCIVLLSDFYVSENGGDGSLSRDSIYNNWNWILYRNYGQKKWKVITRGY